MSKKNTQAIEADVEVVSSKKSNKKKQPKTHSEKKQPNNPFPGMANIGGAEGMPDLSAFFGKDGMPDLSKIPGLSLRQRLTFKVVGLLSNPKLRFLKSKWSIPIWGIFAIFIIALVICAAIAFLIYKLIRAIINPYINIFRRKKAL